MDWQERLRRLDGRLAAEEISMAEYRKLRDEILAEASGGTPRSPAKVASDHAWTATNPGADPRVPIPISAALDAPSGEMTQVVRDDEPTIVVPATQTTDATPESNGTESTRTEAVDPPKPQAQPQHPPVPPAAQLPQPVPSVIPPGPPRPAPGPAWTPPVQGETVFANTRPTNRGRTALLIIAVVVLLAAVGGGAWWLLRGDRPAPADPTPAAPTPAQELSLERLPSPGDALLSTTGVVTVDQAKTLNLTKPEAVAPLTDAGTEKIYFRAVQDGNLTYQLFAMQTGDDAGGRTLAESLASLAKDAGMVDAGVTGLPDGVTASKAIGADAVLVEAVYPTDRGAVRIVLLQSGQLDEQQVADALRRVVEQAAGSMAVR